jgi:hypothetical protein
MGFTRVALIAALTVATSRAAAETPSPDAAPPAEPAPSVPLRPPLQIESHGASPSPFLLPAPPPLRGRQIMWGVLIPGVVMTALSVGATVAFLLDLRRPLACGDPLARHCRVEVVPSALLAATGIGHASVGVPLMVRGAIGETAEQRAEDERAHAEKVAADERSGLSIRERRPLLLAFSGSVPVPFAWLATGGLAISYNVHRNFALDARIRTSGPIVPIHAEAGARAFFLRHAVTPYAFIRGGALAAPFPFEFSCRSTWCPTGTLNAGPGLEVTTGGGFNFAFETGAGGLFVSRAFLTQGFVDVMFGRRL